LQERHLSRLPDPTRGGPARPRATNSHGQSSVAGRGAGVGRASVRRSRSARRSLRV